MTITETGFKLESADYRFTSTRTDNEINTIFDVMN